MKNISPENSPAENLKPEEIRPILPDEKGAVPPQILRGLQCVVDSIQRHGLGVAKLMKDSGRNPISEIGNNPSLLVKGYSSRLTYKLSATYPSMLLQQVFDPETSKYKVSFATTLLETLIGVPLEVSGARESLKTMGKDISSIKEFAHTSRSIFLPFLARNYLGWLVINGDEKDPVKKAGYGGMVGLLTSPLDSLGNKLMSVSSSSKGAVETYAQAIKEIKVADMARSAPIRFVAAAGSAVILSNQFGELLDQAINPLYQQARNLNRSGTTEPSAVAKPTSSQQFLENLSQTNER